MKELILFESYKSLKDADLYRTILGSRGIKSIIKRADGIEVKSWSDYERNFGDAISGDLYVSKNQLKRAQAILKNYHRRNYISKVAVPVFIIAIVFLIDYFVKRTVEEKMNLAIPNYAKHTAVIIFSLYILTEVLLHLLARFNSYFKKMPKASKQIKRVLVSVYVIAILALIYLISITIKLVNSFFIFNY